MIDEEYFQAEERHEIPAYTLLYPEIIERYGLCPYLSLEDRDKRKDWLTRDNDTMDFYNTNIIDDGHYQCDKRRVDSIGRLLEYSRSATPFKVEQYGRYFKKWPNLTPDKKKERLRSFAEWKMPENTDFLNFLIENYEKKTLKVSDIVWDSKKGIITGAIYTTTSAGEFSLIRKGKKTRLVVEKTLPVEKNRQEQIDALLLESLVRGQNKIKIINDCLYNINPSPQLKEKVFRHIIKRYDDILLVIESNPIK